MVYLFVLECHFLKLCSWVSFLSFSLWLWATFFSLSTYHYYCYLKLRFLCSLESDSRGVQQILGITRSMIKSPECQHTGWHNISDIFSPYFQCSLLQEQFPCGSIYPAMPMLSIFSLNCVMLVSTPEGAGLKKEYSHNAGRENCHLLLPDLWYSVYPVG